MAQNVEYIISLRDRFSKNIGKFENSISRLNNKTNILKGTLGGLSGMLSGIGIALLAKNMIQLASDAEETSSKFDVVFKSVGESSKKVAEDLRKNYGLSSKASKQLLSDTGDLLTGFGFTGKQALGLSEEVNKLAVDLASFTNFEGGAEGASQALTKALLGERESVKSLGIAILDKDVKARIKQMEVMGKLKGLTDRQKMAYATLTIAQEQSKNSIGDFARTQDGFANKLRTLKSRWDDLSISVTSKFLPALGSILNEGFKVIEMLQRNADIIIYLIRTVIKIAKYYLIYLGVLKATNIILKIAKVTTVAYRIAMIALGGGIGKATKMIKGFKMALATSGVGIAVLAISFLVTKYLELRDATKQADEAEIARQKTLAEANKVEMSQRKILRGIVGIQKPLRVFTGDIQTLNALFSSKFDKPVAGIEDRLAKLNKGELEKTIEFLDEMSEKWSKFVVEGKNDDASAVVKIFNDAKAKAEKQLGKIEQSVGLKEGDTSVTGGTTKTTKITSSAPRVFNINIDKLVENFSVSTNTLKESTGEVKEAVLNALLGALNDTQIVLNQ